MTINNKQNYVLLVGGSHDGEPWDSNIEQTLRLPERKRTISFRQTVDVSAMVSSDIEYYTLRRFWATNETCHIYGLATMTDMEVQLALLRGYYPRNGRSKI